MLMLKESSLAYNVAADIALLPVRGFEECVIQMNRAAFDRVGTPQALGCYVEVPADLEGRHWPTRLMYEVVWQPFLPGFSAN